MTDEQQEVVFMIKMTDHFCALTREFAEHLESVGTEFTAVEALHFFADSLDMGPKATQVN
jgi:hypothetical protein